MLKVVRLFPSVLVLDNSMWGASIRGNWYHCSITTQVNIDVYKVAWYTFLIKAYFKVLNLLPSAIRLWPEAAARLVVCGNNFHSVSPFRIRNDNLNKLISKLITKMTILNIILIVLVKQTKIPGVKQPVALFLDRKRPEGATLIILSQAKATGCGCHFSGHARNVTFAQLSIQGTCSRRLNDRQQCDELCTPGEHSCVYTNSSGDRRTVECASCKIHQRFKDLGSRFLKSPMSHIRWNNFSSARRWDPEGQCNSVQKHIPCR